MKGVIENAQVRNSALADLRKVLSDAQHALSNARRLAARLGDRDLITTVEVAHRFSHYSEDQLNHIQSTEIPQ